MYKRILVPLDGSELAEQVLPFVRMLGRTLSARIELLRVFDPVSPSLADPTHGLYLDGIIASVRSHVQDYLDKVGAALTAEGLEVSATVHEGSPAVHIITEAEVVPDTLVALCTHGRSGVTRWVLGSTTDKVLHGISQPALVVRARDRWAFRPAVRLKTMLVPLDGSTVAEQILPHAVALSKSLELKLLLVRVTPSAHDYALYVADYATFPFAHIQDLIRKADAEAREYLDAVRERLVQQGVSRVERRVLHGHPPSIIIDIAREVDDCLIAMTTHGGSGIDRWIRGSVADRVVRNANDPVLVVRATK